MLTDREVSAAVGTTAYDAHGGKIGTVEHFYVDDRSGTPSWVAVITGLFGTRTSIVPVQSATFTDGRLVLPVTQESVRSAPDVGTGGHLSPDDESQLRRHYGLDVAGVGEPAWTNSGTGLTPAGAGPADDVGETRAGIAPEPAPAPGTAPAPAPTAAPAPDGGMVRSEERLRVSTEQVAATRVRLVKYVVTEEVQITVPVRREEIRIEEVPLDGAEPGPGESLVDVPATGGGLPDEIVLHTERPVVSVEVVPTERVRLRTELVQGQEQVTGQVQREQIVVDQDVVPRSGG
ncbi:YsnF/AvaK domain-containing protein [Geodermatophilus sp. SYSU D00691]